MDLVLPALMPLHSLQWGFPVGSAVKNLFVNAGDVGLIPELQRSPGGGYDNPLQDSHLENPLDREAWWAAVHKVAESDTTKART